MCEIRSSTGSVHREARKISQNQSCLRRSVPATSPSNTFGETRPLRRRSGASGLGVKLQTRMVHLECCLYQITFNVFGSNTSTNNNPYRQIEERRNCIPLSGNHAYGKPAQTLPPSVTSVVVPSPFIILKNCMVCQPNQQTLFHQRTVRRFPFNLLLFHIFTFLFTNPKITSTEKKETTSLGTDPRTPFKLPLKMREEIKYLSNLFIP